VRRGRPAGRGGGAGPPALELAGGLIGVAHDVGHGDEQTSAADVVQTVKHGVVGARVEALVAVVVGCPRHSRSIVAAREL
jgi:hypothetical protein